MFTILPNSSQPLLIEFSISFTAFVAAISQSYNNNLVDFKKRRPHLVLLQTQKVRSSHILCLVKPIPDLLVPYRKLRRKNLLFSFSPFTSEHLFTLQIHPHHGVLLTHIGLFLQRLRSICPKRAIIMVGQSELTNLPPPLSHMCNMGDICLFVGDSFQIITNLGLSQTISRRQLAPR